MMRRMDVLAFLGGCLQNEELEFRISYECATNLMNMQLISASVNTLAAVIIRHIKCYSAKQYSTGDFIVLIYCLLVCPFPGEKNAETQTPA